ncbi:hypothetical protein like AT1G29670 [Hibiscus trionum]|uniref:GDSL esterase/lipase n=1 Tax=Hibiscus trionum TaxID=183268 RepID=A0A9W7IFL0_HIBTR|nr:hypothetical protein like AT1G29670 [Hibiscus trionum]
MHDFIVKLLGFKDYVPPFAESEGKNILNGVNYASGAAGIGDETGQHRGGRIPFNEQIKYHKTFFLISNFQQLLGQLKSLYDTGARKFAVYGLGLFGCTTYAVSVYGTHRSVCIEKVNMGATLFNNRLKPMLHQLNTNLTDAKFTYFNPSGNPAAFVTDSSCCKTGAGDGELCVPCSSPCSRPRQYIFWDGLHTTDAWNEIVVKSAYDSKTPLEAFPFNIHKLARL